MEELIRQLKLHRGQKVLVLCHDDADSDALGAAWAMSRLLNAQLAVPRQVSEHARELQYRLKIKVQFQPDPSQYDLTVLVDTADSQQLPGCMPEKYVLIDHHPDNKLLDGALAFVHQLVDSTCQLVWKIWRQYGRPLDSETALALGAGIMGDTRNLATAANGTIADLAAILDQGQVSFQQLLRLMRISSRIEREVRLKAALSAQFHQVGECLLVSTRVERNYVYYVAMMLLELGADIALVGYQHGQDCYVRLAKDAATAVDIDLFAVLEKAVRPYPAHNLWGGQDFAGFNGRAQLHHVEGHVLEAMREVAGICRVSKDILR